MKKIGIAFTWSMIMAALAGCFLGIGLVQFDYNFWLGPLFTCGLTVTHGWIQSRAMLMAALGERKQATMAITGRNIPVSAGGMLARFESALPGRTLQLEIEAGLQVITPTGVVISEDEIKHFVGRVVSRQLQGRKGLSRRYWTKEHRPPWERESYETLISCLKDNGFIQGRVGGKTGVLRSDYKTIVNTLKRG